MADEAFAPRVRFAGLVNCVCWVFATYNFYKRADRIAINVMLHGLWIPMSLLIAETGLAEIIKAPSVKLSTVA